MVSYTTNTSTTATDVTSDIYLTTTTAFPRQIMYANSNYTTVYSPTISDILADLTKRPTAKFHCVYCGTQDFDGDSKHTPHCPNCGALMRAGEE